jgi:hypothetical protein
MSNNPKILMEFDPEEVSWLADRLHEMRQGWVAASLMKCEGIQQRGQASENEKTMLEKLEEHKKMEARLRNRLVDKAHDQGFGHL